MSEEKKNLLWGGGIDFLCGFFQSHSNNLIQNEYLTKVIKRFNRKQVQFEEKIHENG